MTPHDTDSTKKSNGGPSWKYIAITCIGLLITMLIGGVTLMASVSDRHAVGIARVTEDERASQNRITKLETQFESIQRELAEIKGLIKESNR